ncbi:DUF4878 domain-containing protein [Williamsia sp. CHRR-6]|uniref:DUF4878 domain-containing protein n=1 Tax=Williamsia sp. CHRR-6 TaxID=2835871 RepID=UPI001BDA49B9|nr:DUF4878 domain-containing protein [Williamsia sp. CHRR-6]MBT0566508.1 DUF4878 domain-containing protein [Williamsia sp. CHRR-6]
MTNQGPFPPQPPAGGYGGYTPGPVPSEEPAAAPPYPAPGGGYPAPTNPYTAPNTWGATPDQQPAYGSQQYPDSAASSGPYYSAPQSPAPPAPAEWSAVAPPPGGQVPPGSVPLPPGFPTFGAPVGSPPAPPSNKSNNKPLIIGGVAVAVVAVLAIVGGVVLFSGGGGRDGGGGSAKAATTAYLKAISDGDAKTALKYVEPPASQLLLTDAVLKKQRQEAPISNATVLTSSEYGNTGTAKVSYRMGDRDVQGQLLLKKVDGTWQIDRGAIDIDLGRVDVPSLTAFGVDVSKQSTISVFPGPIDWGSGNPNYAVDTSTFEYPIKPGDFASAYSLDPKLSETGGAAVLGAVQAYLNNCATSKQTDAAKDKPGCGQQVFAYDAVDGTVAWTAPPVTLESLKPRFDVTEEGKIRIFTNVTWSATFRKRDNSTSTTQDPDLLVGNIDLSADPVVFTPDQP